MLAPLLKILGAPPNVVGSIAFVAAFSIITALHIILGELMPKTLSIQMAETVTLFTAPPLTVFYKIMYPFIWLLNTLSNKLLAGMGINIDVSHEAAHSDEELRQLFEESHKSGLIDQTEMSLMDNVIDFSDRTAREIMIPRTEVICLYTGNSFEENLEVALREQLTRYPVCGTDKDNIVGFIHIKDILYMLAKQTKKDINSIIRPLSTVPETLCISDLFRQMQKKRAQIALLIDEYGGTAGIVTLEDIIEEVFGEIQDEFDEEREPIEKTPFGYSVDGLVLVDDINSLLELSLDKETADTIGGWLYCQIGVDPVPGQVFEYESYQFTAAEVINLRIVRVDIRRAPAQPDLTAPAEEF
jgi:CBS domain containing-hemolysin-like protein